MDFTECVGFSLNDTELVKEYNRLNGTHIHEDKRTPIEKMIDEATGYQKELDKRDDAELMSFIGFVFTYIWLPAYFEEKGVIPIDNY